jgi:hypothetical protein
MRRLVAGMLMVVAGCASANAPPAESVAEIPCHHPSDLQVEGALRTARVVATPAGRSHFHDDRAGCPAAQGCQREAYLLSGDAVLVDRVSGDWACAWYAGKRDATVGYLRVAELAFEDAQRDWSARDWAGHWDEVGGQTPGEPLKWLEFSEHAGTLAVTGQALWLSAFVDAGGEHAVNTGELESETLSIEGGTATFAGSDELDCSATFRRVGDFLVVQDDYRCGGHNVTFSGIYRRVAPRKGPGHE